ncbi:hypothetical protein NQ317_017115 [Molorchus minor]|uniref:Uncharacterized protein n=1 Tax=Molorchus minor TaxID=1323400 RepID=A0ABQ9JJA8_9CUCU|nr:hypothetical protein NQ317_017115 [Molorchus minor]
MKEEQIQHYQRELEDLRVQLQDLEMVIKCLICKAPFKQGENRSFHRYAIVAVSNVDTIDMKIDSDGFSVKSDTTGFFSSRGTSGNSLTELQGRVKNIGN